jgi:uncharacterized protein
MNAAAPRHAALLGVGRVHHHRLRPREHRFDYPTYFLMLPMRALAAHGPGELARNRFALISFHDRDHGDGREDSLQWLFGLLASEGVTGADGEIWLQCYPRVLGFAFKPVSFWYCLRRDGGLAAVVVEVNNTFGERHCYLLEGAGLHWNGEARARKVFHVSPFCRVDGGYRFSFACRGPNDGVAPSHVLARVDYHDDAGAVLRTSLSGALEPLSARALRRVFFGQPLMTWGVVLRIHWQALRLFVRRVPWFSKPPPPGQLVSR